VPEGSQLNAGLDEFEKLENSNPSYNFTDGTDDVFSTRVLVIIPRAQWSNSRRQVRISHFTIGKDILQECMRVYGYVGSSRFASADNKISLERTGRHGEAIRFRHSPHQKSPNFVSELSCYWPLSSIQCSGWAPTSYTVLSTMGNGHGPFPAILIQ